MKNVLRVLVVMLYLACSVSVVFAATAAEDNATMTAELAKVEAGTLTVEQALTAAIEQGVSYQVIVQVCEAQQIPLGLVISAAQLAGQTPAVTVAKLADAGVDKVQLSDALTSAVGEQEATLVYSALASPDDASADDASADQQGEPEAGTTQGSTPEGQQAQSTPETQNTPTSSETQSQIAPGQNLSTAPEPQSQQQPALAYTPAPAAPAIIAVVPVTTNPNPTQSGTVSPSK